ncbi:MAG: ATP-binding cassette domain-containing protein [Maricaulaceae bacterium]
MTYGVMEDIKSIQQAEKDAVEAECLCISIGDTPILKDVSCCFPRHKITTIVGPSGSGKSTLLRSFNRIGSLTHGYKESGAVKLFGCDVTGAFETVEDLRQSVGMVFQKACVFPCSIKDNVLFGISKQRKLSKSVAAEVAETALRRATLWEEVKDRLDEPAISLSLGQKQRLCIARVLAMQPKVLLLDEPTASVDPLSVRAIENTLLSLKSDYTIIMVTHDLHQMRRIADHIVFLQDGDIVTQGTLETIKNNTDDDRIKTYFETLT